MSEPLGASPDRSHPGLRPERTSAEEPPIDLVHLARQCQGDQNLQGEVIGLFRRQARALIEDLSNIRDPLEAAAAAHKMRGSALAVGAVRVARSAALLEERLSGGAAAGSVEAAARILRADVEEALAAVERSP